MSAYEQDLIEVLAVRTGLSTREVIFIVNTFFQNMTDAVANGDDVQMCGFGSFTIMEYDGYENRYPMSGEVLYGPKKLLFLVGS